MTAEIAVMNKSAVALAADSKVTVGGGFGEKTFDTVNKVFTLSKVHPVGLMIYGNAEFMRYPWETIVKLYRAQKKARSEPTIVAWGDDFIRFLNGFGEIKAPDRIDNLRSVLNAWYADVLRGIISESRAQELAPGSSEYLAHLLQSLEEWCGELTQKATLINDDQMQKVVDQYGHEINAIVTHFFARYNSNDRAIIAMILLRKPKSLHYWLCPATISRRPLAAL